MDKDRGRVLTHSGIWLRVLAEIPLTPTLSRWERERVRLPVDETCSLVNETCLAVWESCEFLHQETTLAAPSPLGDGWGEGNFARSRNQLPNSILSAFIRVIRG